MATVKWAYATSAALTCTVASLADNAARQSTAVDNTSNLYLDAMVQAKFKLASGSPANQKIIYLFVYGSEDGTNYTDNATGSDGALTLRVPTNMKLGDIIQTPDSGALSYVCNPFSVASCFGGVMPRKWGVVIANLTGLAFDSTGGNHYVTYTGLTQTVT
jgi:hypothetical protein